MPADVLIYAVVAAGLVIWLRNILGTRHGDENQRHNPFTSQPDSIKNQTEPDLSLTAAGMVPENFDDMSAGLERNMSIENEIAEQGLVEIARHDRAFELSHFLKGAQDAFVMIIESFASGDKDTLKNLLSEPVFNAFNSVIEQRAKDGESASVEIHSIRKTEVMDAQIKDKMAFVTVRFTADETSIVRDKEDKVIFGDPERVTETIDIWTFGRPLRSKSPIWFLYETREDTEDEVSGSTVPETEKS